MIASAAGQRQVGDVHVAILHREERDHDAGGVGDRWRRERSISAVRMTKVRPTAMMPVIETCAGCCRDCRSSAKDGLRALKNDDQEQQREQRRDVAQLRRQPAASAETRASGRAASACHLLARRSLPHAAASSRSLLIVSLANSRAISPLRMTMIRSASDSTVSGSVESTMIADALLAQAAHDAHHVFLGADVHAAGRLGQDQHAAAGG